MRVNNIIGLLPKEQLWHDTEAVATIYRNLGAVTGQQIVTRALAEVAMTMAGLAAQMRSHDLRELPRQLRRLQSMAENLGMVSMAQVAGDLRRCHESGDATASAAVWARLIRVAEGALSAERRHLDQSRS